MHRMATLCLGLLLVGFVVAQDDPKKVDPPSRAEQFKAIEKEAQKAAQAYLKVYRQSKGKEEKTKALEAFRAAPKKFAPQVLELAKAKPDDETGCDAALWLVRTMNAQKDGKVTLDSEGKEGLEIIRKHHLTSPKMAGAVGLFGFVLGNDAPALLNEIFEKNPEKKVKASALRALASLATDEALAYTTAEKDIPAKTALAEKKWQQLEHEFGEVTLGRLKLGEMAKDELYAMKNFFPGCTAPDISGEDTEGKAMKLSDFKGKVIMLDFWGTWCGPCMEMVPHNVEVTKKYADKPFVIVGVNSDKDKEKLAKRILEEKITYNSFWNGEKGSEGAISKDWRVHGWPTVVLIDHKGVIRRRFLGSPDTEAEWKGLNDSLETLVKEAEVK